ncbi:hypothetical protein [Streptomyces sp.]|uniref:hypothetical protein n=1 Tax=Streptomyces sp. TaxID=1931 RepID=UPI002D78A90D|nr:hypothetical protein [Streptomyces sp.]HET6359009.1 hypothetical protein [Streptomyces sp.]
MTNALTAVPSAAATALAVGLGGTGGLLVSGVKVVPTSLALFLDRPSRIHSTSGRTPGTVPSCPTSGTNRPMRAATPGQRLNAEAGRQAPLRIIHTWNFPPPPD